MDPKNLSFDVIRQLGVLRRYARSLVRNQADAEDLVHDALVKAYERRSTFRAGANLRNWLMSIVHNTHIDRLRASLAQKRQQQADMQEEEPVSLPDQENAVLLRQVTEAFRMLPEDQREALHLVAVEELSYQEAADVLGIPVGTLMSRISRARARLRDFGEGRQSPHLRIVGGSDD